MDPVSAIGTVGAVVGLLDVLFKVGSYLNDVRGASKSIESDIKAFEEEIKALISVDKTLEGLKLRRNKVYLSSHPPDADNVWIAVESNREACKIVLLKLEETLKLIIGNEKSSKRTTRNGIKRPLSSHLIGEDAEDFMEDKEHDQKHDETGSWKSTTPDPAKPQRRTGTIQGIRQTLRKQFADPELAKIHQVLGQYNQALSTLVITLNV
jgi:hypothetical protein